MSKSTDALKSLIRSADLVIKMEEEVLECMKCKAIIDESGATVCDDDEICENCLAQNRFSERISYLKMNLDAIKNTEEVRNT